MEVRQFGPMRGLPLELAVIGQGTWMMEHESAAAIRALRLGIEAGATHIDTAEMYGDGSVEELVGTALQGGRRERVFLASKVLPHNAGRRDAVRACERSLRRLRTDRLDLYMLHWPGDVPLEETVAAFDQLVRDGKIRFWGVSNFDVDQLEELLAITGPGQISCNQVYYQPAERAVEHRVLPWCQAHDVALVAYSPFGSGSFPPESSDGGRALAEIAAAHGATPRQIALRFVLRHPGTFTIPKASRIEHVMENAAAGDLRLTADELHRLEDAFPLGTQPSALPMI